MKNTINEIIQILVDNIEISESGFSGELQISGVLITATKIEEYISDNYIKKESK